MADPHEALARFRAAVDAAAEQGRRAVDEAQGSGAAFDRQARRLVARLRAGEPLPDADRLASADLRASAREFRAAAGLTGRDLPSDDELLRTDAVDSEPPATAEEEDFSQNRIMRKL